MSSAGNLNSQVNCQNLHFSTSFCSFDQTEFWATAINGLIEEVTGYLLGEEGKEEKVSHPCYASILLNATFPRRKLKCRCGKCADWAGKEEKKGVVRNKKIMLIQSFIHCLNTPFGAMVKENRLSKYKCHANYPSIQYSNSLYLIMPESKGNIKHIYYAKRSFQKPWVFKYWEKWICLWQGYILLVSQDSMSSSFWKGKKHINVSSLQSPKKKRGEKSLLRIFFSSSFAFVIAVPERRGQLFFLQGANFASAIHDCKKQTQRTANNPWTD